MFTERDRGLRSPATIEITISVVAFRRVTSATLVLRRHRAACVEYPSDLVGCLSGCLVFPDANDGPSRSIQSGIGIAVADHVGGKFVDPPLGIVAWRGGMNRAAVPETTVDVHGYFAAWEYDVGAPT